MINDGEGVLDLKIGIGITTFDRAGMLADTIAAVRAHTRTPHVLFVADDGSTDATRDILHGDSGLASASGSNRGIAWNKNRALYFLHEIARCDVVILLEDDTRPVEDGWERVWIDAAIRHGHINLAPAHWDHCFESGEGTVDSPFVSTLLTAQCVAFSAEALAQVGYMDTRFRRYGFEHAEHTFRMIAAGYGGVRNAAGEPTLAWLINGAVEVRGLDKPPDMDGLSHNAHVFEAVRGDQLYRHAWRHDEEAAILRAEMLPLRASGSAAARPVAWGLADLDQVPMVYAGDGMVIPARGADDPAPRVLVEVIGRSARLLVAGGAGERSWLALEGERDFRRVVDDGAATVLSLFSAPAEGFGLRAPEGFLCRDGGQDWRMIAGRPAMHDWETFRFHGFV